MPTDVSPPPAQLVCCGLVTLDVVQVVDHVPGPDEKLVASGLDVAFGGPAANAAATAVALGVPARLVTALGEGALADVVRAGLAEAGVEVVDLLAGEPGAPALSTVLVTSGTGRRAVVSTNATGVRALGADAERVGEQVLAGATALLVDGHHLAAGTVLARRARARGVPVLLDGGSWKDGLDGLLEHVDHAVLSADFRLPASTSPVSTALGPPAPGSAVPGPSVDPTRGDAQLAEVAARGPRTVARSSGEGPVRLLVLDAPPGGARGGGLPAARSGSWRVLLPPPVEPHEVVDTLGAGDVLHGATAAALARGASLPAALAEGVVRASESVRHAGALGWARAPR